MLELQGIAVSPGVAVGKALILDREGYRITRTKIDSSDRKTEAERLRAAIDETSSRLDDHRQHSTRLMGEQVGRIFSAHQQLLLDPMLQDEWYRLIDERLVSAEYAVSTVLSRYARIFRQMGSEAMRERVADIRDVERSLLESLGGAPVHVADVQQKSILLSHDLSPAETASLDPKNILGFCTEVGGPGGHTAIVARGLEIPAIVGIGAFLHRVEGDAEIIVDGYRGRLLVRPDAAVKDRYRRSSIDRISRAKELSRLRDLPAETVDGTRVQLLANIEFPHEILPCLQRGAEGVGLYRTEFLFLGAESEPSEEEQFATYRKVLELLGDRPLMMRTLDLGADKAGTPSLVDPEENPFLGLRSIRLSLRQPKIFRTQLRAMLRAAEGRNLRVMFPMVSTLNELRTARMILQQVEEDLLGKGGSLPSKVEVGMMVEVPAAVVMLDRFAAEVDFLSLGTNDLIQYTMAVDRGNENVADLYRGHDPAVLRMIKQSLQVARQQGVEVSVCGEMSSVPSTALMLVGLGVRALSSPPSALPLLKQAIRKVSLADCEQLADRAFDFDTAHEVDAFLHDSFSRLLPEMSLGV